MNYVYIAASLDGYIATRNGGLDWLHELPNLDNNDYGYADFISQIDAMVMGRHTYEKVRTFGDWPYKKKVFVLSSVLKEVPEELVDRVEILSGSPGEIVNDIHSSGFKKLYIDGGITIQKFLENDLVDELIVTRIPILLGDGIPLFGKLDSPLRFTHKNTEIYQQGLIKSHYVRANK
jgi:dihydrofolate reductase